MVGDTIVLHEGDTIRNSYMIQEVDGNYVTRVFCNLTNDSIGCRVHMDELILLIKSSKALPIKEQVCLKVVEMDERFRKRHITKACNELIKYQDCIGNERQESRRQEIIERAISNLYRWESEDSLDARQSTQVEEVRISGYSWSSEPNVLADDQYALGA